MAELVNYDNTELLDLEYISNPNLLVNGKFYYWTKPSTYIFTEGVTEMGPDAWLCRCSKISKNTTNGGIDFTTNSTSTNCIDQIISYDANFFNGKNVTLSINKNGTIYNISGTIINSSSRIFKMIRGAETDSSKEGIILVYEDKWIVRYFNDKISSTVNIRWIKLEYGDRRTDELDTEFDESIACSNSIIKIDSWQGIFNVRGDNNYYSITIPTNHSIFKNAQISKNVSIQLYGFTINGVFINQSISTNNLHKIDIYNNFINIFITKLSTQKEINIGWAIFTYTTYIEFS